MLKDTDKIQFGGHKGHELGTIPDKYFQWLWGEKWFHDPANDRTYKEVREYIRDNAQALKIKL
jgi:hypothetical protein